jgi:hypothetical protein
MGIRKGFTRRLWARLSRRSANEPSGTLVRKTEAQQTESPTGDNTPSRPKISIDEVYQLLQHHHVSLEEHDRSINDNLKASRDRLGHLCASAENAVRFPGMRVGWIQDVGIRYG